MALEDLLSSQNEAENPIDASSPPAAPATNVNGLSKLAGSDSEPDNDDAPVQIPRNKLIARLQPQLSADDESGSEEDDQEGKEDEQDGLDAYARLKKELMSRIDPKQQDTNVQPASIPNEQSSSDEDEDEDDMPVRSNKARKLVPREEKSISPRSSPPPRMQSRQPSPGLFVSPHISPVKNARRRSAVGSDSDASSEQPANKDLEERVKRIRAERRAKQQEEEEKRRKYNETQQKQGVESDSDPDGENGRRLTQQSRPTRKAGKKALQEMAREQQRISRNMQLTHQAKTKKRYGTKDLFSKLGFVQVDSEILPAPIALPTPDASSAMASSDAEGNQCHDTPPTSPPSQDDIVDKDVTMTGIETADAMGDAQGTGVVPTLLESQPTSPVPARTDKGKGRAPEFQHLPVNPLVAHAHVSLPSTMAKAVSKPSKPAKTNMIELSDSEEERTAQRRKSRFPVFDRMPEKKKRESTSLLHLRHLAHLTSPGKRGPKGKPSMNVTELQFSLAQKARQQAQKAREEKIEELRRRGIHVETEEEREKHQLEIEDMVAQLEKARQEDLKLRKLERDEAKKGGETGDGLVSSDESDDDYVGSGDEVAAEPDELAEEEDVDLSGSEEDEDDADDEEEVDDEEAAQRPNDLFDDEADDDEDENGDEEEFMDAGEENDDDAPVRNYAIKRKRQIVLDEDEDSETEGQKQPAPLPEPLQEATQEDGMAAAFGFNNIGATLGLTQMFAGTMANMGTESQNAHPLDKEPEQDSIDFLRSLPDTQPSGMFSATPDLQVPNSQAQATQQDESQVSRFDFGISQLIETSPAFSRTQISQLPEPTQDAGLELSRSPVGLAPPPSTIDTVMMPITESPVVKKKGRLQRRTVIDDEESESAQDEVASVHDNEETVVARKSGDAFAVMKKAAKKKAVVDNFNKKTSWAKDVVEEQAEESEDEYAGIGGASDDDSGVEDEEMAKMIDSQDVKVDERKLAAFWAEKDKAQDEKQVNQLYKDLMNGDLRRRRGGDGFDMSDSEDEAEQRRRKKQQDFRKMTNALLADERVGKLAENPKSAAFFKAIADHEDDPDYDFMDAPDMDVDMEASQSQAKEDPASQEGNEDITVPDSQTTDTMPAPINPLKRKSTDSQDKENRPPPNMRRTAPSDNLVRKPMTFADVQHSISELVEDPRMIIPDSQVSDSDSELEITDAPIKPTRKPVIDRLTLSRTSILSESSSGNLAFHAPTSGAHQPGFKVPSLIRRATSNLSAASSTTNSGASTPIEGAVRRGGTGKSNIHAQAREAERRALLEKSDKRRKDSLKKMVGKARGKRSVLGGLDGGFE
ncbi:MRC1-like domain-containing protein [Lophiotrema nucula]|uniref:MRC1-like domain-containing protein n=1 Tax=Lophiotrema nucula TaxID=690887 RepID=A0A6A5ZCN2_9PLEO|nr:MRC1-like domain-containing protein [Lophiotrema nucula]